MDMAKCYEKLLKHSKEIKNRLKSEKDLQVKLKSILLNMVASGKFLKELAPESGISLATVYV
ncbi:MAG TPA: hypothetical protein EYP67_06910 [Methanosarcinales archaeon]|nr:hypothetical protein [Methanosarcinales archaeon]